MKVFKTTLFLIIPFLAMTEGGAMYQRLVNVPLWLNDMTLMKQFHEVGWYFFFFTPPVLILWLVMVISGRKYNGRWKRLLWINHTFYLSIILLTAFYLIPVLSRYVGNNDAIITGSDHVVLKTWATVSLIRQILGFIVIGVYTFILSTSFNQRKEAL